jgi:hypothetical protein
MEETISYLNYGGAGGSQRTLALPARLNQSLERAQTRLQPGADVGVANGAQKRLLIVGGLFERKNSEF